MPTSDYAIQTLIHPNVSLMNETIWNILHLTVGLYIKPRITRILRLLHNRRRIKDVKIMLQDYQNTSNDERLGWRFFSCFSSVDCNERIVTGLVWLLIA